MSYSEIHFFRVLNREFYDESRNINMLVGSLSFWVSKCPEKMGTALKRHKLSIDVIVTLHKIQQINTRYKILQRTLQRICCNQFSFVFFFLLFLSFFLLYFSSNVAPDIFLAFSYTIVSTLSQLKKNKNNFTLTYFMCCLKIMFLVVNASKLIIRIPFERKLKSAINKIYLLAKVSYFLKDDIVKLQNTEQLSFR